MVSQMIDSLVSHIMTDPYWFWFALGCLLLSLQLLGTAGYLLWGVIAAGINAIIACFFPTISLEKQWLLFVVLIGLWGWLRLLLSNLLWGKMDKEDKEVDAK